MTEVIDHRLDLAVRDVDAVGGLRLVNERSGQWEHPATTCRATDDHALAEVGMRAGNQPVDLRRQCAEHHERPDADRDAGHRERGPEFASAEVPKIVTVARPFLVPFGRPPERWRATATVIASHPVNPRPPPPHSTHSSGSRARMRRVAFARTMDEEASRERFGVLLRGHREAAGLTQEELAERSGLTAKGISALERGERRRPYPQTIRTLTDALALSDDERGRLIASVTRQSAEPRSARRPRRCDTADVPHGIAGSRRRRSADRGPAGRPRRSTAHPCRPGWRRQDATCCRGRGGPG